MEKKFFATFNINLANAVVMGCDFSGKAEEKEITKENIAKKIVLKENCNLEQIEFKQFRIF